MFSGKGDPSQGHEGGSETIGVSPKNGALPWAWEFHGRSLLGTRAFSRDRDLSWAQGAQQGLGSCWGCEGCPTTYPCHADGAEPVPLGHLAHAGPVAVEVAAAVAAVAQQQVLIVIPSPANQAGLGGHRVGLRAALESPSPPLCPLLARGLTTLLTDFSQAMDFSSWRMQRDTWAALRHRSSVCRHVRTRGVISYELRGHGGDQPGMGVLPWTRILGGSWGTPPHPTRRDLRPCWPCSAPGRSSGPC